MKSINKFTFIFILIVFFLNFLHITNAATLDPVTLTAPSSGDVTSSSVVLRWDATTTSAADFGCYYILRSTQSGFSDIVSLSGYPIPSLSITGVIILILLFIFFTFHRLRVLTCILVIFYLLFLNQGLINAQVEDPWFSNCISSDKTTTTYTDSGLDGSTTYYYKVYVLDNDPNNYVASNEVLATTPQLVSATAGVGEITISWSSVPGATSYDLYWSIFLGVTTSSGTKITGVTSPYSHSGIINGTTYYYIITSVDSSENILESSEISATPNVPISSIPFSDSNLATCVRDTGAIYASEIASLTCNGKNISNLSGIEYLTGLTYLSMFDNNISDASRLSSLTGLTYLSLGDNSISDASPFASLTGLTSLNLYNNSILLRDISAFSSLTSLTTLSLGYNNINDVSPLASLTNLTTLYLYNNSISDVSSLSSLTGLTVLSLFENNISDVSPLASLTGLTTLSLFTNSITTGVASLVTLTSATEIHLERNYNIPCNDLTTLVNALGKIVKRPTSCL